VDLCKGNKKEMIAVIRPILKTLCLLIEFLDDSSVDNVAPINVLPVTNYYFKSMAIQVPGGKKS
jgi:hypothetical protein